MCLVDSFGVSLLTAIVVWISCPGFLLKKTRSWHTVLVGRPIIAFTVSVLELHVTKLDTNDIVIFYKRYGDNGDT